MSIPSTTSETSPSPQPDQAQTQVQSQSQNQGQAAPSQAPKRSSRRANTAERRATHNAVERARRETLNGRFLDLAAMLPNLAAVRRPSKSAIVNSSIALIHNQGRSRIIAARELRLLNAEANALRQELNEWRARNSLPRVEEPIRSGDFATLLAVEDVEMGEEMVLGRRSFDDGMGDEDEYGDEGDDGAELISPEAAHPFVGLGGLQRAPMQYQQQQAQIAAAQQQQQQQQQQAQAQAQQQQQQLFEQQKAAMARAHQVQMAQAQARYTPPTPSVMHHQHSQSQPANMFADAMFTADLYPGGAQQQTWSQKAIAANTSLATPPGSSHGHKQSSYATTANSAFLSGGHPGNMGMFKPSAYSPSGEDDGQSDGSSHYSGVDNMTGNGLVDQTFSFGLSGNFGYGMQVPSVNMYPMVQQGGIQMPPSPPHTGSPDHSNPQSRRPSVNIPSHVGHMGHGTGSNKSSPSPIPMSAAQQYGMGLMV